MKTTLKKQLHNLSMMRVYHIVDQFWNPKSKNNKLNFKNSLTLSKN